MTQHALIYQPAKTAMQSGRAKTGAWLLEFERSLPMTPDPLMGWATMAETVPEELHLRFETKEAAIAYAEKHGISYEVREANKPRVGPKAYAENFNYDRRKAHAGNN